jgi:hypothetical protein
VEINERGVSSVVQTFLYFTALPHIYHLFCRFHCRTAINKCYRLLGMHSETPKETQSLFTSLRDLMAFCAAELFPCALGGTFRFRFD